MTLQEYEALPYKMLFIPDTKEGGYTVVFPELKGCLSYGQDWTQAIEIAKDALHTWLVCQMQDGRDIPLPKSQKAKKTIKNTLKALVA